jgi:hypothetical protein
LVLTSIVAEELRALLDTCFTLSSLLDYTLKMKGKYFFEK